MLHAWLGESSCKLGSQGRPVRALCDA